jgi:arginase
MKRWAVSLCVSLLLTYAVPSASAQDRNASENLVRIALIKMPYVGERNVPELSGGPNYLEEGGIQKLLHDQKFQTDAVLNAALTTDEEKAYGSWNRLALANGDLAKAIAEARRSGRLPVGLLANCSSILGMLSGLQHSGPTSKPLRVGMIFIDAHGDFNTPETTLSGMLGGMPVAISAGLCLTRLRLKTGLEPALPTRHIIEICVRDTDPLEQELLDRSDIQQLSLQDIRTRSENLHREMKRLSENTDVIYIHVDMDALDPREVPGHPLAVPGGPTSSDLAAALTEMFKYPKAAAFGVASTPYGERDKDGISRQAAYNLILGAAKGVQQRANP